MLQGAFCYDNIMIKRHTKGMTMTNTPPFDEAIIYINELNKRIVELITENAKLKFKLEEAEERDEAVKRIAVTQSEPYLHKGLVSAFEPDTVSIDELADRILEMYREDNVKF